MSNTFGNYFRVTTFGESHGKFVGCVIDGCTSNLALTTKDVQIFLDRRKPGQNKISSSRQENDACEIISGVFQDKTLGSPICILVKNHDYKSEHYSDIAHLYRPNHADYTYTVKYNLDNLPPGGGRASARETVGRVAGGAVAKLFVQSILPSVHVTSIVNRVCNVTDQIKMKEAILKAKKKGDSLGGTILTTVKNLPAGFGEPVFNKLESELAKAMLSIPAAKFFESGDGLQATYRLGSQNNDEFSVDETGHIYTTTNHSGGIQGGISNGMPIHFAVGFKPVSTIFKKQKTVSRKNENVNFELKEGRHDPCVLFRAVVIVECMTWLVLADMLKAQLSLGIKNLQDTPNI